MLLRELVIKIVSRYSSKGFDEAERDVKKLKKGAKATAKDVDGLERSLATTGTQASSTGAKMRKAGAQIDRAGDKARTATGQIRGMGGAFAGAAAGIATAIAAQGLDFLIRGVGNAIAFVGDETERLDGIAKGSQKTGLGIEQYQQLDQVAKLAGTDINKLAKATLTLNANLASGTKDTELALDALKLDPEALQGKAAAEQLAIISRAMEGVQSESEKTLISAQLFGRKAGPELVPLLNAGADAMDEAVANVGRIFTKDDLAKAEAYQDALTNLDKEVNLIKGDLALGLAPAAEQFTDFVRDSIPAVQAWFQVLADKLSPAFDRFTAAVAPWVERLGPDTADRFTLLLKPVELAADTVAFFTDKISTMLEVGNTVLGWLDAIEERFPAAFEAAGTAVDALLSPLETARSLISSFLDFVERSVSGVGDLANTVSKVRASVGLGSTKAAAPTTQAKAGDPLGKNEQAIRDALESAVGFVQRTQTKAADDSRAKGLADSLVEARRIGKANKKAFDANRAASLARRKKERAKSRPRGGGRGRSTAEKTEEPGLLDELGLTAPGTVMAKRPAPENMTLIISTVVNVAPGMEVNITGSADATETSTLRAAAAGVRDALVVPAGELVEIIRATIKTDVERLRAANGGGRTAKGAL